MRIVWILPVLGSLLATLVMLGTAASSSSAPQEAAGYAAACACAIVPYVLARALAAIYRQDQQEAADRIVTAIAQAVVDMQQGKRELAAREAVAAQMRDR